MNVMAFGHIKNQSFNISLGILEFASNLVDIHTHHFFTKREPDFGRAGRPTKSLCVSRERTEPRRAGSTLCSDARFHNLTPQIIGFGHSSLYRKKKDCIREEIPEYNLMLLFHFCFVQRLIHHQGVICCVAFGRFTPA
jgi:hypothetical protein